MLDIPFLKEISRKSKKVAKKFGQFQKNLYLCTAIQK